MMHYLVLGSVSYEMTTAARDYLTTRGKIMPLEEERSHALVPGATFDIADVSVLLNLSDFDGEAGQ